MAGKRRAREGSLSAEIREVFMGNPKLIKLRSNDEVRQGWRDRHQGKDLPKNFDTVLANVKSNMRRKKKGKRGRPPGTRGDLHAAPPLSGDRKLTVLEERIDDCMMMARSMHRAELDEVARMLRRARNKVVLMAGE